MKPRISLALTLHNHQPIGNFGWVMVDVYDRAYRPMVEALERHPTVHVALHYSGPLLEWLEAERPQLLERIQALVARGQVELLGGGLYEPILVSLPRDDAEDQLARMADRMTAITGRRPRGAWLAERVWEPSLPQALAAAGYAWTIVDDVHLRAAALPEEAVWGAWQTEDQGSRLTLFATEQALRYLIPFGKVEDVIAHLRRHASESGDRLGTMGDDGEKFGAWPTTFEHCWGPGRWIDRFFEALEANDDWLITTTPSAWLDEHPPRGLAYVPGGSYAELGEWALPADESLRFASTLHAALERHRPEVRWLQGGSWRNFLVKYREANDLHKQMQRASRGVRRMAAGPARDHAVDHLYRGQSNDCYWHGLFGGLYLPDLRVAALRHLIAAQDLAAAEAGYPTAAELADLDADGRDEVLMADAGQVVTVDVADGGGIGSWDLRAARHPVAAVLRRRPEAYHERLRELEAKATRELEAKATRAPAASGAEGGLRDPGAPASIHDILAAKEQNLSARLLYDDHERRLGLVRFLAPSVTPAEAASGTASDLGDFVDREFTVSALEPGALRLARDGGVAAGPVGRSSVRVEKTIRLAGSRRSPVLQLELVVEHRGGEPFEARLGIELPSMLLGGGGNPAAWWEAAGRRVGHDSTGEAGAVTRMAQGNDALGIAIATTVEPAADAWWAPIETISNSESGFERVYQGSSLLVSWRRTLAAGERFAAVVRSEAVCQRDLAAEEAEAARAEATKAKMGPAGVALP